MKRNGRLFGPDPECVKHKQKYVLPDAWEHSVTGWLEWMSAGGAPDTTLRTRRGHVRGIARRLGKPSPADVTTRDLVALCARAEWSTDHRRGLRSSLVSFFDWAVDAEVVADSPAQRLPSVPESRPRPRPVPDRVWQRALAIAEPRERLMARLAAEAGLRRGEVAQVHTRDLIDSVDGYSLIVHGKGRKQRVVPITDDLATEIALGPGGHTLGRGNRGYLFPGAIDGHLSADRVGVLISELLPDDWTMHKLRHRFATRAYNGTKNIRAVQEALGHASVATTQRYTAATSDEIRRAVIAAA